MNANSNSVDSGPGSQVSPTPFMSKPGRCWLLQEWAGASAELIKVLEGMGCTYSKTTQGVYTITDTCVLCCHLTVCLSHAPSIPSDSGCATRLCSWRLALKI